MFPRWRQAAVFIGKLSTLSVAAKQQANAVRDWLASTAGHLAAKEADISLGSPAGEPNIGLASARWTQLSLE